MNIQIADLKVLHGAKPKYLNKLTAPDVTDPNI
jgi:hypothetical protein